MVLIKNLSARQILILLKSHLGNRLSMLQTFQTTDRLTFYNVVCFNQERGKSQYGSLFHFSGALIY
jgi:hypothetical protein